jgi:glutathione synthase/RimK-type ligase-like ATP-grasp enzyme
VPQLVGDDVKDPVHLEVINGSTPLALLGVLLCSFSGRWISDPGATRAAENKLFQLRIARDTGLATPRTLVSNEPATIKQFCSLLDHQVVVKALRPSFQSVLLTQKLRPEHLASDESLRLCPAIYQEYIPGTQHLRVHIFDDYVSAILIESDDLDWRANVNVPCRVYDLDDSLIAKLHSVMQALNLRMGVVDLKLNGTVPTWLEINPQGQFLFAEGLTGLPLKEAVADFLYREALDAASTRSRS